jgi:ATP-dependent Clp protease ATP-binding subunit ClpA
MNNFMSKEVSQVLNFSGNLAAESFLSLVLTEHILIALLARDDIKKVIRSGGGNPERLVFNLKKYLLEDVLPETGVVSVEDIVLSSAVTKLINSSIVQARSAGKKEITPFDVLVSFYECDPADCFATYFLITELSRSKAVKAIANFTTSEVTEAKDYLENLNEKAQKGKIDPIVGRESEIKRVIQVLCRRKKNNPILVGEPGVGKTAIAEGLALKIVNGQVPDLLKDSVVLSLDIGQLMAGTKYRGEFEEKMKDMLKTVKAIPNSILFIDEIHTIIGAGAVSGGALDSANMLKPLLTQGQLKCLGATTYKEYNNIFEKDAALARRFQKVDVVEPSVEDTISILNGLKSHYEKHHGVTYKSGAIKAAVELANRHIHDRFLPDKAIDVIDEAGSALKLIGEKVVTVDVIERTIAAMAKIPEKSVSTEKKTKLKTLGEELKLKIFGQDDAVSSVVSAIELSNSGLRSGEKPIGSFLFCGPTGVGKTELCKQLAEKLTIPFVRFDMSEYGEKHTVSRLIGAPPGYVGFDQNGLLTEAVRKNPHSVILLDEIEKAHSDIWNILLQVMDHGTLTDNNGRKADFKNCILIMTSNVGAQEMSRRSLGLNSQQDQLNKKPTKAIEQTFSPEFRNRLDAIVYFNSLSKTNIESVLEKYLVELSKQLALKNVEIIVDAAAKAWLISNGYDPLMGARPMDRLIQDKIKRKLAPEIIHGSLEKGGVVKVVVENNELKFEVTAPKKPVQTKSKLIKLKDKEELVQ